MRTVPRNIGERITFYKAHLAKWQENQSEIGITEEDVAMMTELVEQAEEAEKAQRAKYLAAKTATQALQIVQRKMNACGQLILGKIRGKANLDGKDIYTLASIDSPKKASPIEAPGTPKNFAFTMDEFGSLQLKWQCDNPKGSTGTIYVVSRQEDDGAMKQLGIVGKKIFIDNTLSKGTKTISYRVQAVRSGKTSSPGNYLITFGEANMMPKFISRDDHRQLNAA